MTTNRKIHPTSQDEHGKKIKQTTDMITAEDIVEQVVYAVHAPDCCSDSQQAENMIEMLGQTLWMKTSITRPMNI